MTQLRHGVIDDVLAVFCGKADRSANTGIEPMKLIDTDRAHPGLGI